MDEVIKGIGNVLFGGAATLFISLNDINTMVAIGVGAITFIYMVCKVIQIFKNWKK